MIGPAAVAVLFGGAGTLCVVWAFISLQRGEYPSAFVVCAFGTFAFAVLTMQVIIAMGKVAPRVEHDDLGTTLRPDPKVDRLSLISVLGAFAGMLLFAVFALLDLIEIPAPSGDQKYFVVASIAGVVVGLPSLCRIATQRGVSVLRLTTGGVEVGDAYSRASRSWDELSDVSSAHQRSVGSGRTCLTTVDGRTRMVASDWYTPGGHTMRDLVRFYWRHPECRDELTDGRATRRLETLLRGAS